MGWRFFVSDAPLGSICEHLWAKQKPRLATVNEGKCVTLRP